MAMEVLNSVPGRSPLLKTIFYIFIVQMAIAVTLAVPVFASRESRQELRHICKSYSPYVAGIFSASAYVLILLAMKFVTNVSYIQAFRQMSLPLGVLAGIFILKEKCSPPKLIGILLVVSGLVMTSIK
jgi:drug/metabolite transporter (DMT)-like permease